jgi:hypothetical protein
VNRARLLEIEPLATEAARAVSANLGYVEGSDGSHA